MTLEAPSSFSPVSQSTGQNVKSTASSRVHMLGTCIDALSFQDTLARIESLIDARIPAQHVALNAAKLVAIRDNPALRAIVAHCDLISADGASLVWASYFLGSPLPERVTGIDLMKALLPKAELRGWRVYFLGSRREVVDEVARRVSRDYPRLVIAGYRDGYFKSEESPAIVREIAATRPDILFVALPSPRKEYWIQENLTALGVPFCMGVGGSFDVIGGYLKRAPRWMQALGLEWLFRLMQEPRRLSSRYLVSNAKFSFILAHDLYLHWRVKLLG